MERATSELRYRGRSRSTEQKLCLQSACIFELVIFRRHRKQAYKLRLGPLIDKMVVQMLHVELHVEEFAATWSSIIYVITAVSSANVPTKTVLIRELCRMWAGNSLKPPRPRRSAIYGMRIGQARLCKQTTISIGNFSTPSGEQTTSCRQQNQLCSYDAGTLD